SSNVLALFGLRWAAVPADARHPYGRQKIEILAALGIGVLIVVGLFEFAAAAVHSLVDRHPPLRIGVAGFAAVLATMAGGWGGARAAGAVNLWGAHADRGKGAAWASAWLRPAARHTQSDLYASFAVVASFLAARAGIGWADGVATLLLVALIGHAAWEVF